MKANALMRLAAAALVGPLAACTTTPMQRCDPQPLPITNETPVLEMLRVTTGPDGLSHGEKIQETGKTSTYLGAVLRQFQLGDPSSVVIVSGPANFRIPMHAAPYREIFLLLAGSTVIELSDGTRHAQQPGSMVLFEDVTGAGHGGVFGPCGYVALDLQFKPVTVVPPAG
jgi:quercetin dioxygenase-like cupin family protein